MTVKDTIKQSLLMYPSLFKNKLDVYNQLFLTNGNGYHWLNGELVSDSDYEYIEGTEYDVDYNRPKPFSTELAIHKLFEKVIKNYTNVEYLDLIEDTLENKAAVISTLLTNNHTLKRLKDNVIQVLPENIEKAMNDMSVRYPKKDDILSDRTFLYPLCKYADILNLPDDMKPDWKEAVKEMYLFLTESDEPMVIEFRKENQEYINKIDTSKFL